MIEFVLFMMATAIMIILLLAHIRRVAEQNRLDAIKAQHKAQDRVARRTARLMRVPYPFHQMDNL